MPEPVTLVLIPSLVIASAALVNLTMGVSNNMSRFTRFIYTAVFLKDEYIRFDKTKDPLGYAQVAFTVNALMQKLEIAGCRQIIQMRSGRVNKRLVLPDVGCFIVIKEKDVEIEVEPNGFRIWSKAFKPLAADKFVNWLGTEVCKEEDSSMTLPAPVGIRVPPADKPATETEMERVPLV